MDKGRHGSPTLPVFLPGQRRPSVPAADDEVIREDFARYYQQHMPGLIRFVMRYGADPYEAADAAQAAFIEAFRAWHLIHSPAAWLRKVTFRQYLRQAPIPPGRAHRRRTRPPGLLLPPGQSRPAGRRKTRLHRLGPAAHETTPGDGLAP